MKNHLCKTMLLVFLSALALELHSQSQQPDYASEPLWIDMMQDHEVNFYEVQKAFNAYFENRDKGKGSGWKQFKRWEWFMEPRVYPSGERFHTDQAWREIERFRAQYSSPQRATNDHTWTALGPTTSQNVTGHWNPGLGRINVVVLEPGDPNTIYIGTPSGGMWRTENEGQDWEVLTDHLPVIGVSAIAIDYTNTDVIYIGTGDKDASDNYSIGVLKSTDRGLTWQETGINWVIGQERTIAKLLMHPTDNETLFAATTNGLYKTIDGGDNWYIVRSGDIDDLEFKPGNPDVVYCNTKTLYRSTDGGETFNAIGGLPTNYRVQIAVTEANPDYLYFFSSQDGIYRSDDSGLTFTKRSNEPNQGRQDWYDLAFCVSHINPEEVHLGEINTFRSTNGGQNWVQTTEWYWPNSIGYTHCDIHEMVFYGGTLYVGSDGLISKSTDGGNSWENLSEGLSIRQLYRIGGTRANPYKLLGGSQDNGTSIHSTDEWHEWLGADGMECLAANENEDIVYGTSQFGNFYKSNTGGYGGEVSINQPGGGAWVTPFVIHPTDDETLFVAQDEVVKTTNGMQSWTTISNFGGGNLNALAISNSNPDYIFTSRSSTLYRTRDGGESWENISSGLPNFYITYIAIHPLDENKIAVSLSGFGEGYKVFVSDDAGESWTNYSANLPNLPANCVIFNEDDNHGLYVGMDVGIYYRDLTLDDWEPFFEGLPNVIVNELQIHQGAELIRAATYGRGLWETALHPSVPLDITFNYQVNSGGDDLIEFAETASMDLTLFNNSEDAYENVVMMIGCDHPHITLIDSMAAFGTIAAGDSAVISNAFEFEVSALIANEDLIELMTTITYDSVLHGKINLYAFAPEVRTTNISIDDGDNNLLDPGDEATINLLVANTGGASVSEVIVGLTTYDSYANITNTVADFDEILAGNSEPMNFSITVDETTPFGHIIEIYAEINGTNYVSKDTIALTVGLILEDWETADFYRYDWQHGGNSDWTIDPVEIYEGSYSARSGDIGNNQESVLYITAQVLGDGEISFFKKVSCENDPNGTGYDYLSFSIDGAEQGRWDGEHSWSRETYMVESGTRTFSWVFHKDPYVAEGADASWIDYITMPPTDMPVNVLEHTATNSGNVRVFPNPANRATTIQFSLAEDQKVRLEIYNLKGEVVSILLHDVQLAAGTHSILWSAEDNTDQKSAGGVYIYRLTADQEYSGRIVILK